MHVLAGGRREGNTRKRVSNNILFPSDVLKSKFELAEKVKPPGLSARQLLLAVQIYNRGVVSQTHKLDANEKLAPALQTQNHTKHFALSGRIVHLR